MCGSTALAARSWPSCTLDAHARTRSTTRATTPIQNRARPRLPTPTRTLTLTLPGVPRVLLQAGRRAQHLRQGEPRAEQEQQEAQRPARRGRRLGAELQLDVLERRAPVVRGSRRGGWGCVAATRRAVRLTARVDQDAHVARCTFVRVHRHRTRRRADRTHSGAPCGVWLVWLAVWLRGVLAAGVAKALRSSHRSTRSRTSEYASVRSHESVSESLLSLARDRETDDCERAASPCT